jgi:oxygen-dependent protoporphyrinogen oxidase
VPPADTPPRHRIAVIGAGIAGLAAAEDLVDHHEVVVLDAGDRVGGKLRSSQFAGLPAVDEGADAYLTRVPHATALARRVGFDETSLTHPQSAHASIWHRPRRGTGRLTPLPDGLVLGIPVRATSLARSGLISWGGLLRAASDPFRPATPTDPDSIGEWVRARLGDEVHEMLVDPLVGSIYAADTDRFSLACVPQLADLARYRSVLLGARRRRTPAAGPVFETPRGGMESLATSVAASIRARGGQIRSSTRVDTIERSGAGYRVAGLDVDAIVIATPAKEMAGVLSEISPIGAAGLTMSEAASVVMVTLAVDARSWPATGSGYLVPKPHQQLVTAVSFGSNKWAHWRPADGSMILRISLGRDGLDVTDRDDDVLLAAALTETSRHLGRNLEPTAVRITRWPASFPQYRPGHLRRIDEIEARLDLDAPGVTLAGAALRGIGIPACIDSGRRAAKRVREHLRYEAP